jgi:hypothetical protein
MIVTTVSKFRIILLASLASQKPEAISSVGFVEPEDLFRPQDISFASSPLSLLLAYTYFFGPFSFRHIKGRPKIFTNAFMES